MLYLDYKFFYVNSARRIILNKSNKLNNIYQLPEIKKIILFFPITKIEDIDSIQIYNYIYLFKFFFGRRAFVSKIKSFFNLGKWTYSFKICLIIKHKDIYNKLFFIINDLVPLVESNYRYYGLFSKHLKIFYLVIGDMNIFSEKKTNLGLFALEQNINFHLFCKGIDLVSCQLLLCNLKIKFF